MSSPLLAVEEHRRVRLVTLNILLGGTHRETEIEALLARTDADVITLQEVENPILPRRIARALNMRLLLGRPSSPDQHLSNAVLTRLPVRRWRNHRHPATMLRSHLEAELETGGAAIPALRVHCLHLAARFGERANGEARRMREISAVLDDIRRLELVPHVITGDFNAIAPGDTVVSSRFFQRMDTLRAAGLLQRQAGGFWGPVPREAGSRDREWEAAGVPPHLDVGVPVIPGAVVSLSRRLGRVRGLDRVANRFIERWTVQHLLDEGYTDAFRALHARSAGLTCATWMPAARIDYAFLSELLPSRLVACDVIGSPGWPEPLAVTASDHHGLVTDLLV